MKGYESMRKNPFFGKWAQDDEPTGSCKSAGWHGPMISEQEEAAILTDEMMEPEGYEKIRKIAFVLHSTKRLNIENLSRGIEKQYPELADEVRIKALKAIISEFE